jgi:hypothetical protein
MSCRQARDPYSASRSSFIRAQPPFDGVLREVIKRSLDQAEELRVATGLATSAFMYSFGPDRVLGPMGTVNARCS